MFCIREISAVSHFLTSFIDSNIGDSYFVSKVISDVGVFEDIFFLAPTSVEKLLSMLEVSLRVGHLSYGYHGHSMDLCKSIRHRLLGKIWL